MAGCLEILTLEVGIMLLINVGGVWHGDKSQ